MENTDIMVNSVLIVTGGSIDTDFLKAYYNQNSFDYVIGVDKGIEALEILDIKPNLAVGDFDSANSSVRARYGSNPDAVILNPMKDYTDTQAALERAIELKPELITILGATGSRVDHMLGNIHILLLALRAGIKTYIIDKNNRISLIDRQCVVRRDSQYGRYVSLLPYTERVDGITLTGFLYNLEAASMIKGETLGISNEIREEEGRISIERGYLLVLETKD